ncbi:MAG: hypothetical protein HOC91_07250 [Nitrospinaceae bacterium]|jgi:hypothetical protein|nr:hypothetical protein [Nitrospinaceae bacterium]MBT3821608.1 hypothetical protein [Nitrospinaceae bacterium]MBT4430294.1 hypothetical protein [Nitrospinaceae bacterium]MBT5367831.1 hypothetical protein [Nitrospinaceae bacterium]MBT5947725.1 hypothetical protein [Nitrospinaceae bacterium]
MPPVIRLFVKTSLICFVITFASGSLFMLANAIWLMRMPRELLLLHAHIGFVGWLGLMVMGVALWMFPLMRGTHPETKGRYHLPSVYGIYYLTMGGLIFRIIGEPWLWRTAHPFAQFTLIISGLAQLAGIVLFVFVIWRRVREVTPGVL